MLSPVLKEYHEGVFVVTAPGFEERQKHTSQELGEGNFEFIFGLNAKSTSIEDLTSEGVYDDVTSRKLETRGASMALGQICCSLGHIEVYRRIVRERIGMSLVFEDDVLVNRVDETSIRTIVENIPRDAEVINWSWVGFERRPHYYRAVLWFKKMQRLYGKCVYTDKMLGNFYPRDFNDHFLIAGKNWWANAYSVSLEGAEKLLDLNYPVKLTADLNLLFAALNEDIRMYLSKRMLFGQGSGDPDHEIASLTY